MLNRLPIKGLIITGTDTGVGKTLVAGAVADWFRRHQRPRGQIAHRRSKTHNPGVGVCKPVASGCVWRREGLVSEDAEWLAHCADSPYPLDRICPQCYVEPLAPAVAAERSGQPVDWSAVDQALAEMSRESDVMVVEGVGGVLVPMDEKHTMLDVIGWLGLPAVVVARPGLGTINHTLLTIQALRDAGVKVAGVVVNRYPADGAGVAEETNPRMIERWGRTKVLCLVPEEPVIGRRIPGGVVAAVDRVDWWRLVG